MLVDSKLLPWLLDRPPDLVMSSVLGIYCLHVRVTEASTVTVDESTRTNERPITEGILHSVLTMFGQASVETYGLLVILEKEWV